MLSIKCGNDSSAYDENYIYIPLCYLLNCRTRICYERRNEIYIPLCYLLNLLARMFLISLQHLHSTMLSIKLPCDWEISGGDFIYIPLCYLLN